MKTSPRNKKQKIKNKKKIHKSLRLTKACLFVQSSNEYLPAFHKKNKRISLKVGETPQKTDQNPDRKSEKDPKFGIKLLFFPPIFSETKQQIKREKDTNPGLAPSPECGLSALDFEPIAV